MTQTAFTQAMLPDFKSIDPANIERELKKRLDDNRRQLKALLEQPTPFTWDNLMQPMEDMSDELSKFWSPISHLHSVLETDALRKAYHTALPMLTEYNTEITQNEDLFNAISAIASASGLRKCWYSWRMAIQSSLCLSIKPFKTEQSSNPQFIPWPKKGTIACAASPISTKLSSAIHGKHFIVTRDDVGLLKNSFSKAGISRITSSKASAKKLFNFSLEFNDANEGTPSKGKNKVQVKLPSIFGKAISI